MTADHRERQIAKLRALMAKTVANGATEQEELAAARMVAKLVGRVAPEPEPEPQPGPSWAGAERQDPGFQALLEKNTLESLFRAAVQELALNHINTVSPPSRARSGEPVEWVRARDLLEPHLAMMLAGAGSAMGRTLLRRAIDELIYDGLLPERLAIPLGD